MLLGKGEEEEEAIRGTKSCWSAMSLKNVVFDLFTPGRMDNVLYGADLVQGQKPMGRPYSVSRCVLIDTMGSGSLMGTEAVLIMLV